MTTYRDIIIKLIDMNEDLPDYMSECSFRCTGIACGSCPAKGDKGLTLGHIRAMDPRKVTSESEEPEVTPKAGQPSTEEHSDVRVCNCERDYDTSDGHALDCSIRGVNSQVIMVDGVTNPSYYILFDNIEAIEVIARSMTREQFKGYCFGNILKYRLRAGKKSELAFLEKDMAKAGFYGELYEKHKDKCYDA